MLLNFWKFRLKVANFLEWFFRKLSQNFSPYLKHFENHRFGQTFFRISFSFRKKHYFVWNIQKTSFLKFCFNFVFKNRCLGVCPRNTNRVHANSRFQTPKNSFFHSIFSKFISIFFSVKSGQTDTQKLTCDFGHFSVEWTNYFLIVCLLLNTVMAHGMTAFR